MADFFKSNLFPERNLPWFVISKTLTKQQGLEVKALAAQLCAELGPQALAICNSFAITDTMLSAPIALDWVQYNTYDNQGELMSKEEWDRTVMNKKWIILSSNKESFI